MMNPTLFVCVNIIECSFFYDQMYSSCNLSSQKRAAVKSLVKRSKKICSNAQLLIKEIKHIRDTFLGDNCPIGFLN